MTQPKEFILARLVGRAHEKRAIEAACKFARRDNAVTYAFRTPKGWRVSHAKPMGECIVAQPSGVVEKIAGPVV